MAASTAEVKASINRLDKRFDAIAVRVSGLDKLIGSGDLPSLHRASDELKSVIAELTELKKEDDLNINSSSGKPFRHAVDTLLEKTITLNTHLQSAISYQSKQGTETVPPTIPSKFDDSLLEREEIAKLLLLTAKAYQLKRVTAKQKGNIKDMICHRMGYLRLVLQQDDITLLLGALSAIGGEA